MAKFFILIKKKGAKDFLGAFPVKRKASLKQVRIIVKRSLRKGISARVVTESELTKMLLLLQKKKLQGFLRKRRRKRLVTRRRKIRRRKR